MSPSTAEKRSAWQTLRPWLLLGGFVAVWWVLSTGAAQAESTPRLPAHVTERASALTHAGPVRHLADRAHRATETARHDATPVRDHVRTVSHETRSTVQATSTNVQDVVRGHLPADVAMLLHTTQSTVAHAVPGAVQVPEFPVTQGDSTHHGSRSKATIERSALGSTSSLQSLSDTLGTFPFELGARTLAALDHPFQAPFDMPAQAPVSGAFAPLTSILLIGLLDALSLATRSALQDSRPWRLARLPGGTSYDPGSSPD